MGGETKNHCKRLEDELYAEDLLRLWWAVAMG